MGTRAELEGALHLVLEASASEHGRASGWQQRRSPLSPSQFVQTLVFGLLEDPHATLSHLARVAHAVGALVTPQALSQRFTPAAVALLRGVLQDALGVLLEAEPVAVTLLQAFPGGVFLDDTTQIALHDDWQADWPGSGCAAAVPRRLSCPPCLTCCVGRCSWDSCRRASTIRPRRWPTAPSPPRRW